MSENIFPSRTNHVNTNLMITSSLRRITNYIRANRKKPFPYLTKDTEPLLMKETMRIWSRVKSLKTATELPNFIYHYKITAIMVFLIFQKNKEETRPEEEITSILGF